jgi:hypothetical protein
MRVLMLAPGTLGDVAAPAGLGARLRAAGHDVTIVADAQMMPASYDKACAQVRRELGLPAESRRAAERRRREEQPVHHGISPVVLPRPRRSSGTPDALRSVVMRLLLHDSCPLIWSSA